MSKKEKKKDVKVPYASGFKEGDTYILVAKKEKGKKWKISLSIFEKENLDKLSLDLIFEEIKNNVIVVLREEQKGF